MASLSEDTFGSDFDHFDFGLQRILDGLEVLVTQRRGKGSFHYARPGRAAWHRTSLRCRNAHVAPPRGRSRALRCTAPDHATFCTPLEGA